MVILESADQKVRSHVTCSVVLEPCISVGIGQLAVMRFNEGKRVMMLTSARISEVRQYGFNINRSHLTIPYRFDQCINLKVRYHQFYSLQEDV